MGDFLWRAPFVMLIDIDEKAKGTAQSSSSRSLQTVWLLKVTKAVQPRLS